MDTFQTSITQWKNNAKAALTLSFDGGYITSYNLAMEILLRYTMASTWFIVTGCIGGNLKGRPVVNWEQLKDGLPDMETASHTVTHPKLALPFGYQIFKYASSLIRKPWRLFAPNLATKARRAVSSTYEQTQGTDYTEVLAEAIESKKVIEHHLGQPVVSFAYPGGRYNAALKKGIKEAGYLSARATDDGYNFLGPLDFYALKSKVWDITVDADKANRWVDIAVEKGAWLIETYHVVIQDGATGYYYDTAISDFNFHLAYIASQNIWVDTQENIVKYIKQRNVTKISDNLISGEKILLSAKNNLDPTIYNQALTLKTTIPTRWSKIRITQAGNIQEVSPVEENNDCYICYNVLPNQGEITLTPL